MKCQEDEVSVNVFLTRAARRLTSLPPLLIVHFRVVVGGYGNGNERRPGANWAEHVWLRGLLVNPDAFGKHRLR